MICDLQKKIIELKKEKDFCILAHSYQGKAITEIADFVGDSFQLSRMATGVTNKNILMCGVRFMAETVKILSPQKNVYLSNALAGCPMAEQMDKQMILDFKKENPDYTVVCYINTTASLKTVCDVCVTSASAVKIMKALPQKNILFIPDCNLGDFVSKTVPDKNVKLLNGGCPVHASVTEAEVLEAKKRNPDALFLVHPECKPEVVKHADYVGSTSGIIDYAVKSDKKEFIIGTELSIAEYLQFACPDKRFYYLSKKLICSDMKLTTLYDVYHALIGEGEEIVMDEKTIADARRCIDKMIELG
ncbi:MAG: quinolinate synthase NadA [Clostridia bacterium]|nr:quinolinate synthase NadA [Clostridia bacterium]